MAATASAEIIDLATARARRAPRPVMPQQMSATGWALVWVMPCVMWLGAPVVGHA